MTPTAEVQTRAIATTTNERPASALATLQAAAAKETIQAIKTIRQFVFDELKVDQDYGVIPGTNGRRVLLNPGAQKIAMLFNTTPEYDIKPTELGNGHVEYLVIANLISRATREPLGSGIGSCSTMEKKYRYRSGRRKCPSCGSDAIIKTKGGRNPGGYWCVPDKGGCGGNFNPGDPAVEQQQTGQVENPDIADARNTVLKMAKKRAIVDAALGLGCLAEMFTQDVEVPEQDHEEAPRQQAPGPKPAPPPAKPWPTSADLVNRLTSREAAWVKDGLTEPGLLLQFVKDRGAKEKHTAEIAAWGEVGSKLAGAAVKAFEADYLFLSKEEEDEIDAEVGTAGSTWAQVLRELNLEEDFAGRLTRLQGRIARGFLQQQGVQA